LFVHLKIIIPYTIARRPMPAAPPTAHRAAEITPFEVMDVLSRAWRPRTKSLLLGSPSNPTGTLIDHEVLKDIAAFVAERGGVLLAGSWRSTFQFWKRDSGNSERGATASSPPCAARIARFTRFLASSPSA
jgi:hypothetical protein